MKFFLTILSILYFQLSFSQMRVEDIKNDEDVLKFVKKQCEAHDHVSVKVKFCECQKFLNDTVLQNSLAKLMPYIKKDINDDGLEDLIFCGEINRKPSVLAFIANRSNWYTYAEISHKSEKDYSKTYLIKSIAEKLFLFCTIGESDEQRLDTIVYANFSFAPFNSIRHYSIDSIRVIFGSKSGFKVFNITKDGSFDCYNRTDVDINHKYHLLIPNDSTKILFNYLGGLPFYNYVPEPWWYARSTEYDCEDCADGTLWTTRIYFTNGDMISIYNHMATAPYGLQYIYAYIYKLFDRTDMKFIKTVKDEDVPQ